ncbi:MAG: hypothetical protein MJ252_21720, partial [archaeon]|nr:hypothetical protein [archaeon]
FVFGLITILNLCPSVIGIPPYTPTQKFNFTEPVKLLDKENVSFVAEMEDGTYISVFYNGTKTLAAKTKGGSSTYSISFFADNVNDFFVTQYSSNDYYTFCPKSGNTTARMYKYSNNFGTGYDMKSNYDHSNMKCHWISPSSMTNTYMVFSLIDYSKSIIGYYTYSKSAIRDFTVASDLLLDDSQYPLKTVISAELNDKLIIFAVQAPSESQIILKEIVLSDSNNKLSPNVRSFTLSIKALKNIKLSFLGNVGGINYLLYATYDTNPEDSFFTRLQVSNPSSQNNINKLNFDLKYFPVLLEGESYIINEFNFFNEQSQYAYYKITSQNFKTVYVGIIDVFTYAVLSNVALSEKGFTDIGNVFSVYYSRGINFKYKIGFSAKGGTYLLDIPFLMCDSSEIILSDSTDKEGTKCVSSTTYMIDVGGVIFNGLNFPVFYELLGLFTAETNFCFGEKSAYKYYSINDGCLNECPEGTTLQGIFCATPQDQGYYKYKGNIREYQGVTLKNEDWIKFDYCPPYAAKYPPNECTVCMDDSSYNYLSFESNSLGECVSVCPKGYFYDDNHICMTCGEDKPYVVDGKSCAADCPEGYIKYSNYTCESCENQGKIRQEDKCVDSCSEGYIIERVSGKDICSSCISKLKYFYNSSCVDECPETNKIDNGTGLNLCKDCLSEEYIYQHECLNECPEGTITKENNVCLNCHSTNGTYAYKNQCINSCPEGTEKDDSSYSCTSCEEQGKIYFEGKCVDGCEEGFIVETDPSGFKKCTSCISQSKFFFNYSCVEECPENQQLDNITGLNLCKDCLSEEFIYQHECLSQCPEGTIIKENNVCLNCHSVNNTYAYKNQCVDKCPEGAEQNDIVFTCTLCEDIGKTFFEGKCVDGCEEGYITETDPSGFKKCSSCISMNKFFFNYTCVDECPDNKKIENTTGLNLCYDCESSSQYIYQHQCLLQCPEGTIY